MKTKAFIISIMLMCTNIILGQNLKQKTFIAASEINMRRYMPPALVSDSLEEQMLFDKKSSSRPYVKSTQAIKQRLDSVFTVQNSNGIYTTIKLEFNYNTNADETDVYKYEKDEPTNQWLNKTKYTHEYNTNNSLTKATSFIWDATTSQWINSTKIELTYDSHGNKTQYIYSNWDLSQYEWIGNRKFEYFYDAQNLILKYSFNWDENNSEWVNDRMYNYSYNTDNKIMEYLRSNWDENTASWVYVRKIEWTYNTEGYETLFLVYAWDTTTDTWINDSKYEKIYNTSNYVIIKYKHEWDTANSQWINSQKSDFSYDSEGNNIQFLSSNWDTVLNQWIPSIKTDKTYDSEGNQIQSLSFTWNISTNHWDNSYERNNIFDTSYMLEELILPFYFYSILDDNKHMLTFNEMFFWDEDSSTWILENEHTYYYNPVDITAVSDLNKLQYSVFPNPFADELVFSISNKVAVFTLHIFDVQGNHITTKQVKNKEVINFKELSEGIYFYKLYNQDILLQGKLIKK